MSKNAVSDLRKYYHSLDLSEVNSTIEKLRELNSVDSARELIGLFQNCVWRETKFEIIQALGSFQNQRSYEFLYRLALDNKDLPMANSAISALSETANLNPTRFLEALYLEGAEVKKPHVVLALAQLGACHMSVQFTEDLQTALKNLDILLIKNYLYALGELKYQKCRPVVLDILKTHFNRDVKLSALICLGKISREPSDFDQLESRFKSDSFEYEIFKQARNQVQFRSQWKLEDYLIKLFESEHHHKNMSFELNAFQESDVHAGLSLFNEPKNFVKMNSIFAKLSFKPISNWYFKFFDWQKLSLNEQTILLNSLSHHTLDLNSFVNVSEDNYHAYYNCALMTSSKPQNIVHEMFQSSVYQTANESFKIEAINVLAEFSLNQIVNAKIIDKILHLLETELLNEKNEMVQARWLRLAAQLQLSSHKVLGYIKNQLQSFNLHPTILYYCEKNASFQTAAILKLLMKSLRSELGLKLALVRSLTAQLKGHFEASEYRNLIMDGLQFHSPEEMQVECLKFVVLHPEQAFKPLTISLLKHANSEVALHSLVALRSYDSEDLPDIIKPYLDSEIDSIKGRALDSLLQQSHLRAKRIAIDFMVNHATNVPLVEKIIRVLSNSNLKSDYFIQQVDKILNSYPEHELTEQLRDLKMKLQADLLENQQRRFPSTIELMTIDKEIQKELPKFNEYDDSVKACLRSAELPLSKPELYDQFVDKSACILGFTKAIDIFLEKHLGRKHLYPRLESRLHDFQNIIHLCHLNEDYPQPELVIKTLGLEKHFSGQSLPVHKMTLIGKGLLNSKILNDSFKVIDGLRAWSIIILLFCRKFPLAQKVIMNFNLEEDQLIWLSKELNALQELRNPVAHRQTLVDMKDLVQVRKDVYKVLALLEKTLL